VQEKEELAVKVKQYQELYQPFETKISDIKAQPATVTAKKEEKQEEGVSTEVLKPSLLKAKSSKVENVPAWVKVKPE
jgi:hypothetical protein